MHSLRPNRHVDSDLPFDFIVKKNESDWRFGSREGFEDSNESLKPQPSTRTSPASVETETQKYL